MQPIFRSGHCKLSRYSLPLEHVAAVLKGYVELKVARGKDWSLVEYLITNTREGEAGV